MKRSSIQILVLLGLSGLLNPGYGISPEVICVRNTMDKVVPSAEPIDIGLGLRGFSQLKVIDDPEDAARLIDRVLDDTVSQAELDTLINADLVNPAVTETAFLDSFLRFHRSDPEVENVVVEIEKRLPMRGNIAHYGASTGTESALYLDRAPERNMLVIDGADSSVISSQSKMTTVSDGRALTYSVQKETRPGKVSYPNGVDGAFMHRAPPYMLEDRTDYMARAYEELKPGRTLVVVEPKGPMQPDGLRDYMKRVATSSIKNGSKFTEFDLAFVTRVNQRFTTEPNFHMFTGQRKTAYGSSKGVVEEAKAAGFEVVERSPAFHSESELIVLRKPVSSDEIQREFIESNSIRSKRNGLVAEISPRRNEINFDAEERRRYRETAVEQMLTPRYGLRSIDQLEESIGDLDRHRVIVAKRGDETTGYLRMIPFYQVRPYDTLPPAMRRNWTNKKNLVAVSMFHTAGNLGDPRKELANFQVLCESLYRLYKRGEIDGLYAEVTRTKPYQRVGFEVIGESFEAPGWDNEFTPMLLDMEKLEKALDAGRKNPGSTEAAWLRFWLNELPAKP